MTSRTRSPQRSSSQATGALAVKMFILTASLAATLGGWGILALGHVQDSDAVAAQPNAIAAPANLPEATLDAAPSLRQITIPPGERRPVARTRSSR